MYTDTPMVGLAVFVCLLGGGIVGNCVGQPKQARKPGARDGGRSCLFRRNNPQYRATSPQAVLFRCPRTYPAPCLLPRTRRAPRGPCRDGHRVSAGPPTPIDVVPAKGEAARGRGNCQP